MAAATITSIVSSMCESEDFSSEKTSDILSWMENQLKFLQQRPNWKVGGVIGGLKKKFGGNLPYSEESDQLRRELNSLARTRNKTAPKTRQPQRLPKKDGFVLMQVPINMVSDVLQNGGEIASSHNGSARPQKRATQTKKKPRVDTKAMSVEERHAHSASLSTPTTIYLPKPGDAEGDDVDFVYSQLKEKGLRVSNSMKHFKYACANKHRNSSVSVEYCYDNETDFVRMLLEQGIQLVNSDGAAGAHDDEDDGRYTPEFGGGGVTPTPLED
jgi:hypothetical protein